MAKPYSYDLRAKVINAIELDGVKKSEASELLHQSQHYRPVAQAQSPDRRL
jgi:transposase